MAAPQHAPGESPQTFDPVPFSRDEPKTIFLLTSLTSGSSSIITATSRLEHILKSNKVAFKAVDLATDAKARRLWQWKSKGKRLPGVAKDGEVLGNFEDIEEWNEYGELRQNLGLSKKKKTGMSGTTVPPNPPKTATPNIVAETESGPSSPAGGIPTAFSQASIAAAAAAAGKKKAAGIKTAVEKVEGKKAAVATEKESGAGEVEERPAPSTPKAQSEPADAEEEPVVDEEVGEEKVEALKTSVEILELQDEKEVLAAADEESKAPTQTLVEG